MKKMEFKTPEVFVDVSYWTYNIGFSVFRQYKQEFNPILDINDPIDPMNDEEFVRMFENQWVGRLMGIIKHHYPMVKYKNLVLAKDCKKIDIWRNDITNSYKLKRKTEAKRLEFSFNGIFKHVFNVLIPRLIDGGAVLIYNETAEGDDGIAVCILNKKKYLNNTNNLIVASDHDYFQLLGMTEIINGKGEMASIDIPASQFLLEKILMGDKSDEIEQVFYRCGKVMARKLSSNRELLKEKLEQDANALRKFKLNKRLIDMTLIPSIIKDDLWDQYCKNREIDMTLHLL